MQAIAEIFRDLLIFVAAMFVLFIVLIVVVSRMPNDNPLKRILAALSYRVGATVATGAVAIPIEPIPGLDAVYDIGVPILLLLYWISFFKDAGAIISESSSRRVPKIIEHKD
jgi:branched-subunit amino acid permease